MPIALTIAGSDSGGGAGIQADLKTFTALGVHGTSVITAITAQNPRGVLGIQTCSKQIVRQQLEAVFAELPPAACKTGMLFSAEIVETVAAFLPDGTRLVVDPVMIATSGAALIDSRAVKAIKQRLLPRATLVTPNVPEGETLLRTKIRSEEHLRAAARALQAEYGCAILMKGGHLRGAKQAVDVFNDGKAELLLTAPYIAAESLHGTGCTYAAAITAYVARGHQLSKAVELAKTYITKAIADRRYAADYPILTSPAA
jgi:hydroxymethylpyrimidine/phosphomethylpyrimidine kinase